jgi:hypothetical protein
VQNLPVRALNVSVMLTHFSFLFAKFANRPSEKMTRTSIKTLLLTSVQEAPVAGVAIDMRSKIVRLSDWSVMNNCGDESGQNFIFLRSTSL